VVPVASIGAVIEQHFSTSPDVVVADETASTSYETHPWRTPTLLVIGGEAEGESDTTRTYATSAVRIPMAPGVESLNAAVAGSILLFEARRHLRPEI
jgi:TrmH family RNA methyltransferase